MNKPHPRIRKIMEEDAGLRVALDGYEKMYQGFKKKINVMELRLPDTTTWQEGEGNDGGRGDNDEGDYRNGRISNGRAENSIVVECERNTGVSGGGGCFSDFSDCFTGDRGGKGKDREGRGASAGCPKQGSREGPTCKHRNLPATARYFCPECRMTHLGDCRACGLDDPDNELDKKKFCSECIPSRCEMGNEEEEGIAPKRKRSRQAHSGAGTGFLPALSLGDSVALARELCKGETTKLHDVLLLGGDSPDSMMNVTIRHPAKLVIISIGADKNLLKNERSMDKRLDRIVYSVEHNLLHPEGTVAFFVPHPWFIHGYRIMRGLEGKGVEMCVEKSVLLLHYEIGGGGGPCETDHDDPCFPADAVMLAHVKPADGATLVRSRFTCNTRVTVSDVYGACTTVAGASPPCLSTMAGLAYEGASTDIPMRALTFLVNSYSNQGDTVVSIGAECNKGVEVALGRGRRIEAFVGQDSVKEEVQKRIDASFAEAYKEGLFKVAAGHDFTQ